MDFVGTEEGRNTMVGLKVILDKVMRSEDYEGNEAKKYYSRMTEVQWKDKSLEFYEESLNREEFVIHNTLLTIFTDMDRDKEEQITIKAKGEKPTKKKLVELEERVTLDDVLVRMTNDDLRAEIEKRGLTCKVRDTKTTLCNIITKNDLQAAELAAQDKRKAEGMKDIGIKKMEDTDKKPVILVEDLVSSLLEKAKTSELISTICTLSKKVVEDGRGTTLINRLSKVVEKNFNIWLTKNKATVEERDRKYVNIKKLKSRDVKKKGELVSTENSTDAKFSSNDRKEKRKEESIKTLENLKGKKLTEKILANVGWRTLKKLAKERGVKSFGKSREYIVKRLLSKKKKK